MEPEPGEWWAISKTAPKWDCEGTGLMVDGEVPEAAEAALVALEKQYGEPRPHDLKIGWWRNSLVEKHGHRNPNRR